MYTHLCLYRRLCDGVVLHLHRTNNNVGARARASCPPTRCKTHIDEGHGKGNAEGAQEGIMVCGKDCRMYSTSRPQHASRANLCAYGLGGGGGPDNYFAHYCLLMCRILLTVYI